MNILFLDDDNNRWESFKVKFEGYEVNLVRAEDAAQCISHLQSTDYEWNAIFLDHDLGGQVYVKTTAENTGSEVARWITEHYKQYKIPIIIHSWNPAGAKYMRDVLRNGGFLQISIAAFGSSEFNFYLNQLNHFLTNEKRNI